MATTGGRPGRPGGELRRLRKAKLGILQSAAAECGISTTHVAAIELGRRRPSDEVARRLGRALDLTPTEVRNLLPPYQPEPPSLKRRVGELEERVALLELRLTC